MNQLIRIGLFYEGDYFLEVSNYYNYHHPRKARISIRGLHAATRSLVAHQEGVDESLCRIVDAHYFRARMSAARADEHNKLLAERAFDEILASEGVVTHYLPLGATDNEQAVDVWLTLEALELALQKSYDVVVLIVSGSNYVPLVRKLNCLGTRVMVLNWEIEATSAEQRNFSAYLSRSLLAEASYPVDMQQLIDKPDTVPGFNIDELFVTSGKAEPSKREGITAAEDGKLPRFQGSLMTIRNGYGFIERPPNNVFFHSSDLANADFDELEEGDLLEFSLSEGGGKDGGDVARDVHLIDFEDFDEDSAETIVENPTIRT